MKLLLEVADNEAAGFIQLIKNYSYVKAKTLSLPDAELFEEIIKSKRQLQRCAVETQITGLELR